MACTRRSRPNTIHTRLHELDLLPRSKKNHCACSRIHIFIHLLPLRQRTSPLIHSDRQRCKMPGNRAPLQPIAQKKTATAVHFIINKFSSFTTSSWSYRDSNPRSTAPQNQRLVLRHAYHCLVLKTPQNPNYLWSYRDSNPGPLPCKGSALAS